ncbi:MAG: MmcQ/YjbR family DNA-binding protein [Gemmataceae bacterium]|nr:MmcQ/YjbR family DNA-binding protein [Gemmataceae bacterium]
MKKPRSTTDATQSLRDAALRYPETSEGIACEGTALERRTIKVRNKAFLFLGANDAMLKLSESVAEATDLATKEPGRCKVGAHGWVTVTFQADNAEMERLLRWIDESYRLFAPKSKKRCKK